MQVQHSNTRASIDGGLANIIALGWGPLGPCLPSEIEVVMHEAGSVEGMLAAVFITAWSGTLLKPLRRVCSRLNQFCDDPLLFRMVEIDPSALGARRLQNLREEPGLAFRSLVSSALLRTFGSSIHQD